MQLQYFNSLFDGEARRHYRDEIFLYKPEHEDDKEVLIKHYNNATTQKRARQYLQNLSVTSVTNKDNGDVYGRLRNLRNIINKFTSLDPPYHLFDSSTVEYIYTKLLDEINWL